MYRISLRIGGDLHQGISPTPPAFNAPPPAQIMGKTYDPR